MQISDEMVDRLRKLAKVGFGYDIKPEDREALNAAVAALSDRENTRDAPHPENAPVNGQFFSRGHIIIMRREDGMPPELPAAYCMNEAIARQIEEAINAQSLSSLEPQERDGWKPIETAPVGVCVDIWVRAKRKDESGRFCNMRLLPDGSWYGPRDLFKTDKPTHWMPLPAPPHTEGK